MGERKEKKPQLALSPPPDPSALLSLEPRIRVELANVVFALRAPLSRGELIRAASEAGLKFAPRPTRDGEGFFFARSEEDVERFRSFVEEKYGVRASTEIVNRVYRVTAPLRVDTRCFAERTGAKYSTGFNQAYGYYSVAFVAVHSTGKIRLLGPIDETAARMIALLVVGAALGTGCALLLESSQ